MAQPFATCSLTLHLHDVSRAVAHIAGLSLWCEVHPLPDDQIEVRLKEADAQSAFPGLTLKRHEAAGALPLESGRNPEGLGDIHPNTELARAADGLLDILRRQHSERMPAVYADAIERLERAMADHEACSADVLGDQPHADAPRQRS